MTISLTKLPLKRKSMRSTVRVRDSYSLRVSWRERTRKDRLGRVKLDSVDYPI
jgi:hypothetical protein